MNLEYKLASEDFGAIKDELKGKTVVSVAAGWDFEKLSCLLGDEVKVQYILPNTPVEICNGVIVMENVSNMGQDERLKVKAKRSYPGDRNSSRNKGQ